MMFLTSVMQDYRNPRTSCEMLPDLGWIGIVQVSVGLQLPEFGDTTLCDKGKDVRRSE